MIKKYFLIPISEVTNRMLNSSTSRSVTTAQRNTAGTHVLLEALTDPAADVFLDYPMYYTDEARELIQSNDW